MPDLHAGGMGRVCDDVTGPLIERSSDDLSMLVDTQGDETSFRKGHRWKEVGEPPPRPELNVEALVLLPADELPPRGGVEGGRDIVEKRKVHGSLKVDLTNHG